MSNLKQIMSIRKAPLEECYEDCEVLLDHTVEWRCTKCEEHWSEMVAHTDEPDTFNHCPYCGSPNIQYNFHDKKGWFGL